MVNRWVALVLCLFVAGLIGGLSYRARNVRKATQYVYPSKPALRVPVPTLFRKHDTRHGLGIPSRVIPDPVWTPTRAQINAVWTDAYRQIASGPDELAELLAAHLDSEAAHADLLDTLGPDNDMELAFDAVTLIVDQGLEAERAILGEARAQRLCATRDAALRALGALPQD